MSMTPQRQIGLRPTSSGHLDDGLPPDEARRAHQVWHRLPALGVRLAERVRLRPGGERGLVRPDGVRRVQLGALLEGTPQEVEGLEPGDVLQIRLPLAPGALEV